MSACKHEGYRIQFMEMVESTFGDEMVEKMVEVAVGTYDHQELVAKPSRRRLDCQLMLSSRRLEITCLVVSWSYSQDLIMEHRLNSNTIHDVVHVLSKATLPDFVSKISEVLNTSLSSPRHFADLQKDLE